MKVISKPATVIAICAVIGLFLLAPLTNAQPATNSPASEPFIFVDVPLDVVIQALAREADINYLIDPRIIQWWERSIPNGGTFQIPIENLRLTNTTPREALEQILAEHHLVLLQDPPTGIARITYPKQTIQPLDPDLYAVLTNKAAQVQPNIQFTEVPLDVCLQAMARDAGINYMLDPQIGWGKPDANGQIRQPPVLTCAWHHVTSAQVFIALCENYGLSMTKDPVSGVFEIGGKVSHANGVPLVPNGGNG